VHADRERIERVLANLVSNAVKFTEAGGSIRIEAGRPERGRVKISVRDTGRGIPERFRPHLFGRFAQASPERGGTGLGLAIVKGILDAHASRIHVESREGRGTEIAFDLECKEGEGHGLQNGHGD
jgi:signal transduction histidine kinase